MVPTPHGEFCVWALTIAINVSAAICQLTTCNFSPLGKKSTVSDKFDIPPESPVAKQQALPSHEIEVTAVNTNFKGKNYIELK